MLFLNRKEEMSRLDELTARPEGGLAVIYGRRRIGKTRLLLEWAKRHDGLYSVADQSSGQIQRRYFAESVGGRFDGFAEVEYPDWRSLLTRLAREAGQARWRGPVIFDELPYLVLSSPELPSVLQRWIDHEAREARLVVAVAGSSQRMMQGLVLSGEAPLYGRANEVLELRPLNPIFLKRALHSKTSLELIDHFTAWGGVPRYWEFAASTTGSPQSRVERLVLNPLAPLHREPDRLLLEEVPSALEVRPVLDAIGAGAHRVSEIAGRVGSPATSMSRPLDRLIGLGLVRRETPFAESEKKTRRSLYKIADPFFRLWFRVVAPHRGRLATDTRPGRLKLLERYWKDLAAHSWEDLCRERVHRISSTTALGKLGPWGTAARWWKGDAAEWDLVAESMDGRRLLLGEVKWSAKPLTDRALQRGAGALAAKPMPDLSSHYSELEPVRALFVPEIRPGAPKRSGDIIVVTAVDMLK